MSADAPNSELARVWSNFSIEQDGVSHFGVRHLRELTLELHKSGVDRVFGTLF